MDQLKEINLSDIQRDPDQPRNNFDKDALEELSDNIRAVGVVQPISVRKTPAGIDGPIYMIVAGERRWRASKLAERKTIPAVIKDIDVDVLRTQQLTENLFRENLNPVEEAEFIQSRIDSFKKGGVSNASTQVAEIWGVSTSWISKKTAILKVSEEVRELVRNGKIRDYTLIKKVDKLKGERRQEAMTSINGGVFNAKEFFKRKRYDNNKQSEITSNDTLPNSNSGSTKEIKKVRSSSASFDRNEIIGIIEKTKYNSVLDQKDKDWRNKDILTEHLSEFREWIVSSPPPGTVS